MRIQTFSKVGFDTIDEWLFWTRDNKVKLGRCFMGCKRGRKGSNLVCDGENHQSRKICGRHGDIFGFWQLGCSSVSRTHENGINEGGLGEFPSEGVLSASTPEQ
jgi:hypothetical protein